MFEKKGKKLLTNVDKFDIYAQQSRSEKLSIKKKLEILVTIIYQRLFVCFVFSFNPLNSNVNLSEYIKDRHNHRTK